MFGLFKKDKKPKEAQEAQQPEQKSPDISAMSDAKQQLFAQLKAKRDELGPAEIAKMQKAVEMQALQKKVKHDIVNDEKKRDRLLDEIRFHMQDK